MSKDQYHHGSLKRDLITKGLQLLNREGYEGLSLRKVAVLCGVSHAAPYKHFSNKDELIAAITQEVANSFTDALQHAARLYPHNPSMQLVELGKQYVRFMVENPDYLKFIFMGRNDYPVAIKDNAFVYCENHNFGILKECAENYLASIQSDEKDITRFILSMWSLVHGITVLLVNKSITWEGDYLELVTQMIVDTYHIKLPDKG